MQGMSERQYAAHVGLSRGAIQKAKTAERLVLYPDGSINAAASDARRAETTDPSKTRKPTHPKLKPVPEAAVAAVSVGVVKGRPLLDIDYSEDAGADVDFNVVMTDQHAFVEIQGTAEKSPFTSSTLDELLVLASTGLDNLFEVQKKAIARI